MYRKLIRALSHRIPQALKQGLRARGLRLQARWRALRRGREAPVSKTQGDCRYCGRLQCLQWQIGSVAATHPGPFERDAYQLKQCVACAVVYLDPLPSAADLVTLYQHSIQFSDPHYSDPLQAARTLDYYAHRLATLKLLPQSGDHCLEVGAGLAWVSRAIKQSTADAPTWAQDLSSECVDRCPWVDHYQVAALETLPALPPMALISLTHVIEHVPDPNAVMQKLATLLRPGGHLFVTAPFRPPHWRTQHGIAAWRDYSYLHVPAHISYLSKVWLQGLAAQIGLKLVHWEQNHDGHQAFEAVLQKPVA